MIAEKYTFENKECCFKGYVMKINNNYRFLINKNPFSYHQTSIRTILMLLLFTSTDTVLFGTNAVRSFLYVPRIVGLLVCLMLPLFLNNGHVKFGKESILCVLLVLIILTSGLINEAEFETLISRIIPIIVAYSIATYCTLHEFAKVFCEFMRIVATVAILIEAIAYIFPSAIYSMPLITNTAGYSFSTCFFGAIRISHMSNVLIRASGIFWEPGAFAVYLNLALFFQLFVLKKHSKSYNIIYCIAQMLTFSTAGYICFLLLMIIYLFFFNPGRAHTSTKFMMIIILTIGFCVILNSSNVISLLFDKIINQENTVTVRWLSLIGGFNIVAKAPLLGIFSNSIRTTMNEFSVASGGMLTNTWVYQFAAFGIPFGSLFTWFSCAFFAKMKTNTATVVALFVFLLLSYMGETFFSFLPFIFVFYGLRDKDENSSN